MLHVSYRKARQDDFPRILQLLRNTVDDLLKNHGFYEISPFSSSRAPPPAPQQTFPWFEFALKEDSDGFWIAEVGEDLAGIGLSWVRGPLWYLAHLFVSPDHQGLNVGRSLLDKTFEHRSSVPITNRALMTFAYNPVSISLYTRYGMYAREPLYSMEAPREQIPKHDLDLKVKPEKINDFQAHRKALSEIDLKNTGYVRDKNHEFLHSLPTVQCYLFMVDKELVGYSYAWKNGRIGPLAALSHSTFKDIVRYSIGLAAGSDAQYVGMLVTGSNETLMKIALENKMRIVDNYLFMSSSPLPNFSNYVLYPTGSLL